MTLSRSHCRQAPPVSWLLAMRKRSAVRPGTVAIWWAASVFLLGTGQLIHEVVLMATWVSYSDADPAPMAAEWRSGVPVTTETPGGGPRSEAIWGVTLPMIDPVATSRGSLWAGMPTARTSTGSYSR